MQTVSVVMSTYNGDRYLEEQLQSLADQVHLPHELVVADDGSTDGTWDIVQDFAARAPFPVVSTRNSENLGYGASFLAATGRASGRLVAFCDQDDVWHPDKLATAAETPGRDRRVAVRAHRSTRRRARRRRR